MFKKIRIMVPVMALALSSLFVLCSCGSTAVVDIDVTDTFDSNSGNWSLNTALALYYGVEWDFTTNPGSLTMWGAPNSPSYTGMKGMIYTSFSTDTKYTLQVDARFATIPAGSDVNAMAKILVFFNSVTTDSFDCLMIRSDGTWELRSYDNLAELNPATSTGYVPIDHAVLPSGAFNPAGVNAIKITQNGGTVGISINGVALTTPTNWGMCSSPVRFGLGFEYGSALPATPDGSSGPAVLFDNFAVKEFE